MNRTNQAGEKAPPSVLSLLRQTSVVIPTFNASSCWSRLHRGLKHQGLQKEQVLIIDSSSTDNTQDLVRRAGYRLQIIPKQSFRHGATRQLAADSLPWAEILVYFTQDAVPCGDHSIRTLLRAFCDPSIGAAYGRQLPRAVASPIERHARLFNYTAQSSVRDFDSRKQLGFKAAFFSNSFAAYRRSAFESVGGFPKNTIVSEEITVAARMLMAGWKVAYQADATVIHSHPLTLRKEFARYFDIGVHLGRERWMLEAFGKASGEGRKFVVSELNFLWNERPSLLPLALLRTLSKFISYELGKHERYLPGAVKRTLSAQPDYWQDERLSCLQGPTQVDSPSMQSMSSSPATNAKTELHVVGRGSVL